MKQTPNLMHKSQKPKPEMWKIPEAWDKITNLKNQTKDILAQGIKTSSNAWNWKLT